MTVSVQQRSQQQPGIVPGVRGQQPQLTRRGRAAHEAVAEGGMGGGEADDSSAVSGECADGSPSERQKAQQKEAKELPE